MATAKEQWKQVIELQPEARPRRNPPDSVLVRDEGDVLDEDCIETLARAQATSGADAVTCGVRLESGIERLFLGEPHGLGLLANHYGVVGLIRRSLLADGAEQEDPWPLLARLSLEGATIVSVPRALAHRRKPPGDVEGDAAAALLVAHEFERHLPPGLRSLARLGAGLAAGPGPAPKPRRRGVLRKLLHR
jgi:hypothetical protein